MAKKSTSPEDRKPDPPARVEQHGGGVYVGGNVTAGRDVVYGDQTNYNLQDQRTVRIENIHTPAEFVLALQQVRAELAALKAQPQVTETQLRRLEAVAGDVEEALAAAEAAGDSQPEAGAPSLGARINATLAAASETMENLTRSLQAAGALGATIALLAQAALRVFGG